MLSRRMSCHAVVAALVATAAASSFAAGIVRAAPAAARTHGAVLHGSARPLVLSTADDRALYARLCAQVDAAFDSARGGWVEHGTPNEDAIELALARGRDGDPLAGARGRQTLAWLHTLADTVGGGYVTAERDLDPRKATFEKITIPNARRLELLTIAGGAQSGSPWHREALREVDYFERVLLDPMGGFVEGQGGSRDLQPEACATAVQAWWRWSASAGNAAQRAFCDRSTARLWKDARAPDLGFVCRNAMGVVHAPSLLPDQVEMGRLHLIAWQIAGRDTDRAAALAIAAEIRTHFEDPRGGYRIEFATERFGYALRNRRPFDDDARAAHFFAELAAATRDTACAGSARRTWLAFDKPLSKAKLDAAEWALAIRALWANDAVPHVTIARETRAAPAVKRYARPKVHRYR